MILRYYVLSSVEGLRESFSAYRCSPDFTELNDPRLQAEGF